MSKIMGLRCKSCGKLYPPEPIYVCEECFGGLEVIYEYDVKKEEIEKGPKNIWRYKKLLPVNEKYIINSQAGFTPLVRAKNLGEKIGLKNLYIKNDSVNHPTFSFKDRVVSVAVSKAKEFGFNVVACASTGNLANSLAAHAAIAKMDCYIFVPKDISISKIVQTLVYEPKLILVDGNYDDVNRLAIEISSQYNWAFVNVNLRPYYAEGSKTLAYEVVEQLNWEAPDFAFIPVASGSLLTMIWKGLNEFKKLDFVKDLRTRLVACQPRGCNPVVQAFRTDGRIRPVKPNTIEKSLAIGNPADGIYAIRALKESKGLAYDVTDDEIIEGIRLLAKTEGIFTETAGGVVIASLKKAVEEGAIDPGDVVVAYITGNGLKTQEVLHETLRNWIEIKATMEDFEEKVLGIKRVRKD